MKEGYKDSALGEIPVDWEVDSIENVFEFIKTKSLSRAQLNYSIGEIYYVHYGDIHSTFKFPIVSISRTILPLINEDVELNGDLQFLNEGDLIIADASEDLEGVGKCIELADVKDEKIIGGLHTIVLRDKNNITSIGIKPYLLYSPLVLKSLKRIATGASVLGISKGNLKKINIPLPPLPEQQKIAEVLSTVDDKIDIIDHQISETQSLKKGLMQRLLTKGIGHTEFKDSPLGEIPMSWDVVKLGEICSEITYGLTVRPKYIEEGVPLISAKEIVTGIIDYEVAQKISQQDFESLSEKAKPKEGDLFLSKTGTIGRSAIYMGERPIAITQNIAILRVEHPQIMHRLFILQYMKFTHFLKSAISKVNQSTIMDLQLGDIKTILIPNPSVHEQQKISDILSSVDEKLEVLSGKKTHYQELKQGLMQQLLTGKIRVNTLIDKTAMA